LEKTYLRKARTIMAKAIYVEVEASSKYLDENERLIKKFIKKVKKDGLLELVRERRHFQSKSEKRRRKKERKKRISRETTKKNNR
jgi:ribosomal protein S21